MYDKISILNKRISIIDNEMESIVLGLNEINGESEEYTLLKSKIYNMLSYRKALINEYNELLDIAR
jgi:hypothetical protein